MIGMNYTTIPLVCQHFPKNFRKNFFIPKVSCLFRLFLLTSTINSFIISYIIYIGFICFYDLIAPWTSRQYATPTDVSSAVLR